MSLGQRANCFDFHQHDILDYQINDLLTDVLVLKNDGKALLLLHLQAEISEFDTEGIFVGFFYEPLPQRIVNVKGRPDDLFCEVSMQ